MDFVVTDVYAFFQSSFRKIRNTIVGNEGGGSRAIWTMLKNTDILVFLYFICLLCERENNLVPFKLYVPSLASPVPLSTTWNHILADDYIHVSWAFKLLLASIFCVCTFSTIQSFLILKRADNWSMFKSSSCNRKCLSGCQKLDTVLIEPKFLLHSLLYVAYFTFVVWDRLPLPNFFTTGKQSLVLSSFPFVLRYKNMCLSVMSHLVDCIMQRKLHMSIYDISIDIVDCLTQLICISDIYVNIQIQKK